MEFDQKSKSSVANRSSSKRFTSNDKPSLNYVPFTQWNNLYSKILSNLDMKIHVK